MTEPTHVGIYEGRNETYFLYEFHVGTSESLPRKAGLTRVRLLKIPVSLQKELNDAFAKGQANGRFKTGSITYTATEECNTAESTGYNPKANLFKTLKPLDVHRKERVAKRFGSLVEEHCLRRLKRAGITHARTSEGANAPRRNQVQFNYNLPIRTDVPIDRWINAVTKYNDAEFGRVPRLRTFKRTLRRPRQ